MSAQRPGRLESFALFMLLAGQLLLPVLGWLIGVACVWQSRVWTVRDKLIAALVPPGGFAPAAYLLLGPGPAEDCSGFTTASGESHEVCSGGLSPLAQAFLIGLLVVLAVAPFVTAFYLHRRARPPRAGARASASPA